MTEEEAWAFIKEAQRDLPARNRYDDYEIVVLSIPVEVRDENGYPTGEWDVAMGWHCWALRDGPHEYGNQLGIAQPVTLERIYSLIARNVADTMGTVRIFRSYEEAVRAAVPSGDA